MEYTAANDYRNYLMHYGRKGMKWGENRFGNWYDRNVSGRRYRQMREEADFMGSSAQGAVNFARRHNMSPRAMNNAKSVVNTAKIGVTTADYKYSRTVNGIISNFFKNSIKITKNVIRKGRNLCLDILEKLGPNKNNYENIPSKKQNGIAKRRKRSVANKMYLIRK